MTFPIELIHVHKLPAVSAIYSQQGTWLGSDLKMLVEQLSSFTTTRVVLDRDGFPPSLAVISAVNSDPSSSVATLLVKKTRPLSGFTLSRSEP